MSHSQHDPERSRIEEIADLKRRLAEREREIDDLRRSSSWRVTAPLRAAGLWLQRLKIGPRGVFGRRRALQTIDRSAYQEWIARYSTLSQSARAALRASIETFSSRPLISVIMPNYNVDLATLDAAISSVRSQIYPNWELCISDDASTREGTRALLEKRSAEDQRIRLRFRDTTGNISINSNSAIDLASGDYLALLDADDLLAENALYWVAREVALHPEVDLIFTDEDKLDERGRFDPYFKPAWNPALMLAQNAFSHLGVYRRSLVEKVGRFRAEFDGAQDHDLVLRCAEASSPDRIRHIPRILYHWRAAPTSTAASLEAKPQAWRAGRRAISEHLGRRHIPSTVDAARNSYYQVEYQAPSCLPFVSLIVMGRLKDVRRIDVLLDRTRYDGHEFVLVGQEDQFAAWESHRTLRRLSSDSRMQKVCHRTGAGSASAALNEACALAKGEIVCFIRGDVEPVSTDWLEKLVARALLDKVAGVGPMLRSADRIESAGMLLVDGAMPMPAFAGMDAGETGYMARAALEQNYICLPAECLLLRRDVFQKVGGFDLDLSGAAAAADLCLRIHVAGYQLLWTPVVQMNCREPIQLSSTSAEERILRARWQGVLDDDPCYNPNLSLEPTRQFQLALPPRVPLLGARLAGASSIRSSS
jgi:glycosyltransferase involved in cell wall biosynthesis